MYKLLIACLVFFFGCMPTAYGAEDIFIPNTAPQELRAHLVGKAREADALIREQSDAFLIVHTQPASKRFYEAWGSNAYLRHLYRFYPTEGGTRVSYEIQAINGDQPSSFSLSRIGDYRGRKSIYAGAHLNAIFKGLILLRKEFGNMYLYGMMLGLKKGDTADIAVVFPDTPCAEAGLTKGDQVIRFAGADVSALTDFGLMCRYLQCELDARPLTLTILRDGKPHSFSIEPRLCTPEEYVVWEKKAFFDDDEMEEL